MVVQRQEAAGLVFTKTVFKPGAVLGRHTHVNAYMSFAAAGSYTEKIGRATRICDASSILLHPAGETHEDQFHDRPVHLLRVEITDANLLPNQLKEDIADEQSLFLCRRMLSELQRPDDLTPLVLQGLAYEAIAHLARASRPQAGPKWLKRVDELLNETYLEPMRISQIAEAAGVHPVHLCRTYSKLRRRTIGDRVRELRLSRACQLLAGSDQPIGEIAASSGFADQSHLSRLMRRRLGISPTEYRASR